MSASGTSSTTPLFDRVAKTAPLLADVAAPVPTKSNEPKVGSSLLINWVWTVELSGAVIGFANAAYTTFGDAVPNTVGGLVPAAPMLMLPVLELGRVPMVSAIYSKKPMARCFALICLTVLTYPAVENWTIGFDRIAEMRVRAVVAIENTVDRTKADQAAAENEYGETLSRSSAKRTELRNSIATRDQNIAAMNSQLKAAGDAHESNLDQIRSACRIVREQCLTPRSRSEDQRYQTEVSELSSERAKGQKERQDLVGNIDQLVKDDEAEAAKLGEKKRRSAERVDEAEKQVREARNDNVIYRLAAFYFRTRIADLTPSQIGFARWVFAVVPAFVCAMAGPLGAMIHYSPHRTPGAPSFVGEQVAKLMRARRAYLARRRRSLPVSDGNMVDFLRIANAAAEDAKPKAGSTNSTKREAA